MNRLNRRMWAIAALVGAMVADLAETIIDPANSGNATKIYDAALDQHGRMVLSAGLLLASSVLIVPGVNGISIADSDGRPRLGMDGTVLAVARADLSALHRVSGGSARDVWCSSQGRSGACVGARCCRRSSRARRRAPVSDRFSTSAALVCLIAAAIGMAAQGVASSVLTARAITTSSRARTT